MVVLCTKLGAYQIIMHIIAEKRHHADDEGVSSSEPESMERDPQANAAEIPGSGRVGWGKDEAVLPVPKVTDAAEGGVFRSWTRPA